MNRLSATIVYCTIMILALVTISYANDQIIDTTIQSATTAIDSRGGEYVRLIVNEKRQLQGTEYEVGVPVMIFSSNPEMLSQAKLMKSGDHLKAIVSGQQYNGRMSYTVIKFLPAE